jgi:hypothetical protein
MTENMMENKLILIGLGNLTRFLQVNSYHAALNYPVVSNLVKAINKGYLKGFPSLTSRHTSRSMMNQRRGTGIKLSKAHNQQKLQPQQPSHPHFLLNPHQST